MLKRIKKRLKSRMKSFALPKSRAKRPLPSTRRVTPPMRARVYYVKAYNAFNQKKYQEAIQHISKAIQWMPKEAEFYFFRGNCYLFLNQYSQAIQDYKKAIFLNPNMAPAYYNIGCAYARQNKKKEALLWLTKAIHHGFKDLEHMKKDPDLKSLHQEKEFQKLFQKQWK